MTFGGAGFPWFVSSFITCRKGACSMSVTASPLGETLTKRNKDFYKWQNENEKNEDPSQFQGWMLFFSLFIALFWAASLFLFSFFKWLNALPLALCLIWHLLMQTYIFMLSLLHFLGGSWTKRIWAKAREIQGDSLPAPGFSSRPMVLFTRSVIQKCKTLVFKYSLDS